MRNATSNQDVIRTCDVKIREAQRTIGWFEDSVRELEHRAHHAAAGGRSASPASNSTGSSHTLVSSGGAGGGAGAAADPYRAGAGGAGGNGPIHKDLPKPPPGAAPSYVQPQAYGAAGTHGRMEATDAASSGGAGGAPVFGGQKAKEQFTNLGTSLKRASLIRLRLTTTLPVPALVRPHQGGHTVDDRQDLEDAAPTRVQAARRATVQGGH